MEKLKIYIGQDKSLADSAIAYLNELEYSGADSKFLPDVLATDVAIYTGVYGSGVVSYSVSTNRAMFDRASDHREVTIEDLRDMVVLRRNDVSDATHTDQDNWKWFITSNGESYVFAVGNAEQLPRWDKSTLDHVDLTPIQKPQEKPTEKEYLNKNTGEVLNWKLGQPRSIDWIEIPDDAEVFMSGFYGGHSAFYKDNFTLGFSPNIDSEWWDCRASLDYLKGNGGKIVWQRNPPSEPETFLKEYLTPDFRLVLAGEPQDGWREVPEGADIAVQFDNIYFYNDKFEIFTENGWQESGFESLQQFTDLNGTVIWQRDPQPEPETELDDSSLLDVVYHYSASFNTARGTVSYDGVITFPGRITGIADYQQVRAEIAKDGNVTPEQVNVHSLTIVG